MAAHSVSADWKDAKKAALTARAAALGDALAHLTDIEEMLEADGRSGDDPILTTMRGLAAHFRSMQRDYESEAGRAGA